MVLARCKHIYLTFNPSPAITNSPTLTEIPNYRNQDKMIHMYLTKDLSKILNHGSLGIKLNHRKHNNNNCNANIEGLCIL